VKGSEKMNNITLSEIVKKFPQNNVKNIKVEYESVGVGCEIEKTNNGIIVHNK
jgi:hypothetical protein